MGIYKHVESITCEGRVFGQPASEYADGGVVEEVSREGENGEVSR